MKTVISYLSPVAVPDANSRPAQALRRLQQSTAATAACLEDVEEAAQQWDGLTPDQRKAAQKETGLDSDNISKAAKELISAKPKEAKAKTPTVKKQF